MLPVIMDYSIRGADGVEYFVEIEIYPSQDLVMFPEGVNGTFRLFLKDDEGEKSLIYLIDNHHSRVIIHVMRWLEAWERFQIKCREITR